MKVRSFFSSILDRISEAMDVDDIEDVEDVHEKDDDWCPYWCPEDRHAGEDDECRFYRNLYFNARKEFEQKIILADLALRDAQEQLERLRGYFRGTTK